MSIYAKSRSGGTLVGRRQKNGIQMSLHVKKNILLVGCPQCSSSFRFGKSDFKACSF